MEISKVELDSKIESFIEAEQEKYETNNGISCNYTPFCFVAKHGDEMIGAVSGAASFLKYISMNWSLRMDIEGKASEGS